MPAPAQSPALFRHPGRAASLPGDALYCRVQLPRDHPGTLARGQTLELTGILTPLPEPQTDERSFESYLRNRAVYYRLDHRGPLLQLEAPGIRDQFCHTMNHHFQHWLRLGAPQQSSVDKVYLAMLLGRKAELDHAHRERYRMSGTMHLFAISGLHIGVIATVLAQAMKLVRVPGWLGPCIGLPLLYAYVEITGATPSAVRAFLMTACFWASFACQRQRSPLAALIASACLVLLIAPCNSGASASSHPTAWCSVSCSSACH